METTAELDIGRELLYLSGADVEACAVSAGDMNDAVEAALAAKVAGRARTRPKLNIRQPDGSSFRAKAGVLDDAGYAAIKWFGYFPGNGARGAPDFHPLVMVNETRTGLPVAMMDGVWLSGQRTAAFSAVAAKRLARAESETLGFVACGRQARCNLAALRAEFPIRRVIACSRRRETAERFAAEVREQGLEAVVTETPREVVSGADIVITSVPHAAIETPFLDAAWLAPGAFVSMVDLGFSWKAETIRGLDIVAVDDIEQSLPGGPEPLNFIGEYDAELGDIVAGHAVGRSDAVQRTGFIFSGIGLGDTAAAALILDRAIELGLGTRLPL
ncbi:MAG: ornithine cyclodeaminase family protein [Proteobacteria bacterium]|nr:ornithine cyclodeaminase family protein [Pseudomonadota bacterium]